MAERISKFSFISILLGIIIATLAYTVAPSSAAPPALRTQKEVLPPALPAPLPVRLQTAPTATLPPRSFPTVVIISPKNNEIFEQGQPITVSSRSFDPQGIARVDLVANGRVVATQLNPQPEPNQALLVSQFWLPDILGNQVVQVVAYNTAGAAGKSEFTFVQVVTFTPTVTPEPTLTATPAPTPTPAQPLVTVTGVSALRVRQGPSTQYGQVGYLLQGQSAVVTGRADIGLGTWWQIRFPGAPNGLGWVSGSPTYATAYNTENVPFVTPPPLPTPTPTPMASIDFRVDRTEVRRGECVTFFWNVFGVRAVYFQGEGVIGENQNRRECPSNDKTYSLRVERADGTVDTRYIGIDVRGDGTGFNTTTIHREAKIDFDNSAQQSGRDNEFRWTFRGDRPVFEKVDDDDDDIRLVALERDDVDEFDRLSEDTCRWYLEREDKRRITIEPDLIVCFSTDKDRTGKLRFTGGNPEELVMQWHVW
ncbi:MAG: SH3 domain-containing protein [Anaerolineae bacterium]|nr:SH3 domain-containing protein [Anaerolineae bacterium]